MAPPPCKSAIFRGLCPFTYAHLYSAVAQQGAVQPALRRGGRAGLRECSGAAGGAAVWAGGQHRARHRSAVSGALGGGRQEAGLAADGGGRDSSGEEAEVPDRGQQLGNRRTVVVWPGTEEGDPGRVLREAVEQLPTQRDPGGLRGHVGAVPAKPGTVGTEVPDRI